MLVDVKCNECGVVVKVNIDTEGGTLIAAHNDELYGNLKLITMEADGSQFILVLCNSCKKEIGGKT